MKKFTLKTKIELAIAGLIISLIPFTIWLNRPVNHLYEAKMANTTCYGCNAETYEIGSKEAYNVGDSVIVDETMFVDMTDTYGRIYVITKDNGTIETK